MKGIIMDYAKLALGLGLGAVGLVTSAIANFKINEGLGMETVGLKNLSLDDVSRLDEEAGNPED